MSSNPYSKPIVSSDVQSAAGVDAGANASSSRRLEDRVAEFLQSFENSFPDNLCLSRFGQNISTSEVVQTTLLTQSTASPVQTQPQALVDPTHTNLSSETAAMNYLQYALAVFHQAVKLSVFLGPGLKGVGARHK